MHPLTEPDQKIIEDIRAGRTHRYSILVDRHKDRAMTLALRLVGMKEEAEELVQDAFVRAFNNLDQFRGEAKFSTWFYRILYNLCMTKVTRRKAKPELLDVHDEMMLDNIFVDQDELSIQQRMENDEMQRLIASEIENLPEKLRSPVVLFYVQEMSYDEMASVLDAPLGTVKTNLFRGRNLLRQLVLAKMKDEVRTV